jgi:tetratricopeptide (TPR) repeat protein
MQYAREALALAQKSGDRSGEAWALFYLGHAYLLTDELERAQTAFQESVRIRDELVQPSLAMEPLAGLVDVALRKDELESAVEAAEKILVHFEMGGTLDGTDEPLRVYHTCYLFLKRKQDPRRMRVLQNALQLLHAQASKFRDEQARKMYLQSVPWRLALQEAAKEING